MTVNIEDEVMDAVEAKIVRSFRVANELLEKGNKILNLKRDNRDESGKSVVYVFLADQKFQEDMDEIMRRRRQEREDDFEARVEREVEERLQKRLREMSEE